MRSPDTAARVSYSAWHRCESAHRRAVMEEGGLFTHRAELPSVVH